MSMGTWDPLEEKWRPGLYNRFIGAALARIKNGPRGYVGIPVKADWGPVGEMVHITGGETQIKSIFGVGGEGTTTHLLYRIMLAGKRFKPTKIVAYRMATSSAKAAAAKVDDAVEFTAKYPGRRGNNFSISIVENLLEDAEKDVKLYEGSTLMATYTVSAGDVDALVEAINVDSNALITAKKLGNEPLADVSGLSFAGGDSGLSVTADDYLAALDAFEAVLINVLVLDGVTDKDILLSTKTWVNRVRNDGKEVMFVQGGSHADDKDPDVGNARSKRADHEAIVNVVVGTVDGNGNQYNSAETACQIAGLIAGCPINKAVTYKELEDVEDVTVELTNEQIILALRFGSFVLVKDVDLETGAVAIKVEQGLTTLTTYGENRNEKFSKIRVIRTLDAIDYDTGRWAAKNIIGELDNHADGRSALISGIKLYLETLANQSAISKDFLVEVDNDFISEGDTVYLRTQALPIDSIEKIFNSIYV